MEGLHIKTLRVKHDLHRVTRKVVLFDHSAQKAHCSVFLNNGINDLLRRADYYCITAEIQIVVVHCCVEDRGNRASAQNQEGSRFTTA